MLRGGVTILLAFALGACSSGRDVGLAPQAASPAQTAAAAPPSTGQWQFNLRTDRATGKPVGKVYVITQRVTVRSRKPFASSVAGLQLQCFKDNPVVQFVFRYRVGSNRSANLTYRFDDKPPRDGKVKFLPTYKTVVIEDRPAVRQFVAELRAARTLFVSINSLVAGATRAEFPVQDAGPAIDSAFADCGPPPRPQRRVS